MANDVITDPPHPLDIIVPTKVPETALAVPGILNQKINDLYARMGALPEIVDQETLDGVRAVVKDAAALKRAVETCRQLAKEPFLRVGQAIDREAATIAARLDVVIEEGKKQQATFAEERDRKIAEQQRLLAAAEAAAQKDQSRPTPPLTVLVPAEEIKIPITRRRKVVIKDRSLIPAEYWIVDEKRVEADVLAGKIIPGTVIEIEQNVVAR